MQGVLLVDPRGPFQLYNSTIVCFYDTICTGSFPTFSVALEHFHISFAGGREGVAEEGFRNLLFRTDYTITTEGYSLTA